MKSLVRLRVGPFCFEDALTLPQMEVVFKSGFGAQHLYPPDHALGAFPAIVVNEEQQNLLVHGNSIQFPAKPAAGQDLSRVYTASGDFLAMVKYEADADSWHPEKVFLQNDGQR
jgi:tRNA U55 pseudouridine synthase TruB